MFMSQVRARAALAFAASEGVSAGDRAAALVAVSRAVHRLAAIDNPLTRGFSRLAEAGLTSARGDADPIAAWARAEQALLAADCKHYAAAAKRRRGVLTGGDEGAALVAEAEAWLAAEGGRDPVRLAAMMAPG
jgi:eukaryotic-like serine/threonine-protein kinase